MNQEHSPSSPETLEQASSPERGNFESIDTVASQTAEKVEALTKGTEYTGHHLSQVETIRDAAQGKLRTLRNAALLALFINAAPALAQNAETAPTTPDQTIETLAESEVAPVQTDTIEPRPEATLENATQLEEVPSITTSQASGMTEMLIQVTKLKLEEAVDDKKQSLRSLIDEKTTGGEKMDAGLNLAHSIPGLANKVPLLSVLSQAREVQKDISAGKPISEVIGNLALAVVNAKTLGIASFVWNAIKAQEEARGSQSIGAPEHIRNPISD